MAANVTPADVVKTFVLNLQKKQRNLVKRKGKLDHYKELINKGETLNEEQKKAVDGYEGVLQSITLLQEIMIQTKELIDDVEVAVRDREKQFEESLEEHTINFMRMHVCVMQLINALDNVDLRTAIVKSSSPHHLRMLDTIRELFVAPVTVDWPGTNTACLSNAPEFIQKQPGFDNAAKHIHNLILGRPIPIPLPEDYDGPQRKFNFKEARTLCFRLLATPAIQRCLGAPISSECTVPSNAEGIRPSQVDANPCTGYETHGDFVSHNLTERPHEHATIPTAYENHLPHRPLEEETVLTAINGLARPPGGTFNFLQASKVMSPEPVLEYPLDQRKHHDAGYIHADPVIHSVEATSTHIPTAPEEFEDRGGHVYSDMHSERYDRGPMATYNAPVEQGHTQPLSEVELGEAMPVKPSCYADLFRRQNQQNQTDGHRESQIQKAERPRAAVFSEISDTKASNAELPSQTSTRGRGGGDLRGGRGFSARVNSRGFMSGPPRRPYGGPRIGRGGGGPQSNRGRANLHGAPPTNVAQA